MNRRVVYGCLLVAGMLLLLVVAVGGWFLFRSVLFPAKAVPASPVSVFLLSPSDGDEAHAGDFVLVTINAQAPAGIASAELFVDGQSLGSVRDMPERASWTWQAWPPGIHTLSARATDSGAQVGQSQTVIVNVLALNAVMQISAGAGQTLAQVGEKYGVPPDQMAGANPHVDANQPLKDGQPVNVPTGGGGGGAPQQPPAGGGGTGGASTPSYIIWDLKLTKQVDKSYCYISTGDGLWDKLPKQPFDFFQGLDNLYTQLLGGKPKPDTVLQADCWGWLGGVLQYLGKGQTKFDPGQPDIQLVLDGTGFQLIGTPHFPPANGPQAYMIKPHIEAPYALREPKGTPDCLAHKGNSFVCDATLNAALRTDIVLEWEWLPGLHWPNDPAWITQIDGYDVYEIDPSTQAQTLMKEVIPEAAKVAALPLPWGARCYGVQAYADASQYGGKVVSPMSVYCPGQPPALKIDKSTPSQWVTQDDVWFDQGDCPTNNYYNEGYPGINTNTPTILVGAWIQEGGDCEIRQGAFTAGVKFSPVLPPGGVFQKAVLSFAVANMQYGATHVAIGASPASCVVGVGKASLDWSSLSVPPHVFRGPIFTPAYAPPFAYIGSGQADVTPIVAEWLSHPGNNHGFFLTATSAPDPMDVGDNGGSGVCLSWLKGLALDVYYFAP